MGHMELLTSPHAAPKGLLIGTSEVFAPGGSPPKPEVSHQGHAAQVHNTFLPLCLRLKPEKGIW